MVLEVEDEVTHETFVWCVQEAAREVGLRLVEAVAGALRSSH